MQVVLYLPLTIFTLSNSCYGRSRVSINFLEVAPYSEVGRLRISQFSTQFSFVLDWQLILA